MQLLEKTTDGDCVPAEQNKNDTVIVNDENNVIKLVTIGNEPGVALPSTGSTGTTLYTVGGLSLMSLAAMMYWVELRKRRTVRRRSTARR